MDKKEQEFQNPNINICVVFYFFPSHGVNIATIVEFESSNFFFKIFLIIQVPMNFIWLFRIRSLIYEKKWQQNLKGNGLNLQISLYFYFTDVKTSNPQQILSCLLNKTSLIFKLYFVIVFHCLSLMLLLYHIPKYFNLFDVILK